MLLRAAAAPSDLISRWKELHNRYADVLGLLAAVANAPFMYGEQRFMATAQAAEVFHRIAHGGTPIPKPQHQARVESIMEADIPDEHREWAEKTLREANRLRLNDRLLELFRTCPPVAEAVDVERLARTATTTRNYLTHLSNQRATVVDGADRWWVGTLIEFVLRYQIILHLGVGEDEANERLRRSQKFNTCLGEVALIYGAP